MASSSPASASLLNGSLNGLNTDDEEGFDFSFKRALVGPDSDIRDKISDPDEEAVLCYDKSCYETAEVQLSLHTPQIVTSGIKPYRVVDVNQKWLDFCGFCRDEVVGETLQIL